MKFASYRRRFSGSQSLNSRGDTIVEVLLAMLVISVILGGAFVLSRASLTGVRQSQERGEALKVAESQTEQLRVHGGYAPTATTNLQNNFCFAPGGTTQDNPAALPANASTDDFSTYHA